MLESIFPKLLMSDQQFFRAAAKVSDRFFNALNTQVESSHWWISRYCDWYHAVLSPMSLLYTWSTRLSYVSFLLLHICIAVWISHIELVANLRDLWHLRKLHSPKGILYLSHQKIEVIQNHTKKNHLMHPLHSIENSSMPCELSIRMWFTCFGCPLVPMEILSPLQHGPAAPSVVSR